MQLTKGQAEVQAAINELETKATAGLDAHKDSFNPSQDVDSASSRGKIPGNIPLGGGGNVTSSGLNTINLSGGVAKANNIQATNIQANNIQGMPGSMQARCVFVCVRVCVCVCVCSSDVEGEGERERRLGGSESDNEFVSL